MAQKEMYPLIVFYLLQTFNNTLKKLGIEFSELRTIYIFYKKCTNFQFERK